MKRESWASRASPQDSEAPGPEKVLGTKESDVERVEVCISARISMEPEGLKRG